MKTMDMDKEQTYFDFILHTKIKARIQKEELVLERR